MIKQEDKELYKKIMVEGYSDTQNNIFHFQVIKMMEAGFTHEQIILEQIKISNEVYGKLKHCIEVYANPLNIKKFTES